MKVHVAPTGRMTRINKALDPGDARRASTSALTLIEPEAADGARRRAARRRSSATRSSTTRTASRSSPTAAATSASRRSARSTWVEVDDHARPRARAGGRLPLLTRMIGAPLSRRHRPRRRRAARPAARRPADLRRRPRRRGRRARAWARRSPSTLRPRARERRLLDARRRRRRTRPTRWPSALRAGSYDALVGIGGGRTLDVAKLASTLSGLPMVAVATSLAHDGIASPVASLEEGGRKGSYGVQMPIALVVDLDYVRRSEPRDAALRHRRRDLQPLRDRRLAARRARARRAGRRPRGDVRAAPPPRRSCTATDGIDDDDFLVALAEALVLSGPRDGHGRLEPPVQRRRPRDPARDRPPLPRHGAPRRAGRRRRRLFTPFLRERRGDGRRRRRVPARATGCRARRPTSGSSEEQFAAGGAARAGDAARPLHGARAPRRSTSRR